MRRGDPRQSGFLVLNPCSFTRRAALELEGVAAALPVTGPVKASQLEGNRAFLVAELLKRDRNVPEVKIAAQA